MPAQFKRHSLLRRNPDLSQEQFSQRYQHHHGPLAASLPGFRKVSLRYLQNHVLPLSEFVAP